MTHITEKDAWDIINSYRITGFRLISGQHASFYRKEDGLYCAEPHEGGAGYYKYYYEYDSDTGDFIRTN